MVNFICSTLAGAICFTDQCIKNRVEEGVDAKALAKRLPGFLKIKKVHNKGIALNGFEDHPEAVKTVTTGITGLIAGAYGFLLGKGGGALKKIGFSMLVGGAMSNVCDRMRRGYVVDYVAFRSRFKKLGRIYFNIADLFIVLGSIFIVADEFIKEK